MKLVREIVVYEKSGEKFLKAIVIDVALPALKEIFKVNESKDPEMFAVYPVTEPELAKLVKLAPQLASLDLNKTLLFCDCTKVD